MKFLRYMNENIKEINEDDVDELIQRDCQPWLKASQGEVVYRGAKNKPYCYKGTVRTDRRPVDTKPELQIMFDNIIQKKYGFKPRSNGLFVTGNIGDATRYGRVYRITPIGKFKFLWSPLVRDFYATTGVIVREYIEANVKDKADTDKFSKILGKKFTRKNALELPEIQAILKKHILDNYTNKNLPQAINSYKEIMVVTKEFYAAIK